MLQHYVDGLIIMLNTSDYNGLKENTLKLYSSLMSFVKVFYFTFSPKKKKQ